MMRNQFKEHGFTLVELMVVVAIIGLLSAVAIPNFQKYQARSKQTEAKLQLASIYTSEASFFADYTVYASCLNYMGYNPSEEITSRYYATGFFSNIQNLDAAAVQSAVNSGLNTSECVIAAISPQTNSSFFPAGKSLGSAVVSTPSSGGLATDLGTQASASNMTYIIGAAGIIHKAYSTSADCSAFTIDEKKQIKTIRNGF